ncbi:G-protein coupled receptor Mth2 isoform X2 [Nilaparvata lugens]|uniref:G-protein coupled receptor Mth2 isoform X2 n=1 Tax=Nilaparvata lugens TaxID=108931 RepID=UPI00193D2615|nr:G-protein coupled receptor Mth2 isoform X2 [Nilaparvata lugens]
MKRKYGYMTHYALLCHFFWLNVMSFDIWLTFRTNAEINWMRSERRILAKKESKRLKYYILYACGVPLLIVLITYLAQKLLPRENAINPRVGHIKCFIEQSTSKNIFYFYPLTVLAVLNIILYSCTAQKIFAETKKTKQLHGRRKNSRASARFMLEKRRFTIYLKLFIAMGVSWIAEPLSGIFGHFQCGWLLLDLCNASLGLPVFVLFICKRRTLSLISQRLCPKRAWFATSTGFSYSSSSSSNHNTSMVSRLPSASTAALVAKKHENTRL